MLMAVAKCFVIFERRVVLHQSFGFGFGFCSLRRYVKSK